MPRNVSQYIFVLLRIIRPTLPVEEKLKTRFPSIFETRKSRGTS